MGREIFNLNFDWKFHLGDDVAVNFNSIHSTRFEAPQWMKCGNMGASYPEYPDGEWEDVQLPHDFILQRGDFSEEHNVVNGSLGTGIGWYRRLFELPAEDEGRRIHLEFDGIFRDSQIWVNGHLMGRELSGYSSLTFDISEYCRFGGLNAIAVRCAAMEPELWSYEGGGMYRNVRLIKTASLFVPSWGTFVRSEETDTGARLLMTTEISNEELSDVSVNVVNRCFNAAGEEVVLSEVTVSAVSFSVTELDQTMEIDLPELWSPDNPVLYTMETTLFRDDESEPADRYVTTFGIRFIRFDAREGFFLNGESVKIKGVCCHQDHGGVGAAVPDALQDWRIKRLKDMGTNGYRASHNPASPALLDACDRQGMLVMDENRILGVSPIYEGQLENMIRRGRNHPSIILWSLGNEEMTEQHTTTGIRIMRKMQEKILRLDPTRPVTYAMNCTWIDIVKEHEKQEFELDVFGANYTCGCRDDVYDEFHETYPNRCFLGSETGGSASTRGLYEREYTEQPMPLNDHNKKVLVWSNPEREGIVSAYSETYTAWGRSIMDTWKDCHDRPNVAGTFLWTGFDYRGEVFPYDFPSVITRFGIMDLCGLPKDAYHYYRAWWQNEPTLHIFPHWDWKGREGEEIEVWCYSNQPSVELFLNWKSLGKKDMEKNGHLVWVVPYEAGELKAVGSDMETIICTSGNESALMAESDRSEMRADGEDVIPVNISVRDDKGDLKPRADNPVFFSVEGPARILGVGNGNPVSHEPDNVPYRRCFHGYCQVLIQSTGEEGEVILKADSPGLESVSLKMTANAEAEKQAVAKAVYEAEDKEKIRSDVDKGL